MQAFEVIGYAIDGAFYCAGHAKLDEGDEDSGHATPLFAGDEGADDHTCSARLAGSPGNHAAKEANQ